MNINDLTPQEYVLEILHPATKQPTGGTITLVGRYSPEFYNAAKDALRDKNIYDTASLEALELMEEENINQIAACVIGWDEEFFCAEDGTPQECSHENVVAMFRNPKLHFVKNQVEAAVLNIAHFFRTPNS